MMSNYYLYEFISLCRDLFEEQKVYVKEYFYNYFQKSSVNQQLLGNFLSSLFSHSS